VFRFRRGLLGTLALKFSKGRSLLCYVGSYRKAGQANSNISDRRCRQLSR
jgi:hypothetical protein